MSGGRQPTCSNVIEEAVRTDSGVPNACTNLSKRASPTPGIARNMNQGRRRELLTLGSAHDASGAFG